MILTYDKMYNKITLVLSGDEAVFISHEVEGYPLSVAYGDSNAPGPEAVIVANEVRVQRSV